MNLEEKNNGNKNGNLLQGIFNATHEGISILDKNLTVLKVNRTMEQWYSHAMPLVGKKCYQAYQNRSEPCNRCPSLKTIEDKKMHVEVVPLVGESGEVRLLELYTYPLIDGSGYINGVIEFVREITEQYSVKMALQNLRLKLIASEKRWQYALEGSGDGVWDWNPQSGEVYYSRRWKEMLGYSEDEIGNTGREWTERIHTEDKKRCYSELERHLNGESPFYEIEHRLRCKDGSYKWFLDRGKIIERSEDGKPLRMIGTHSDISGLKRTQEALEHQLNFEKMVADISSALVNLTLDKLDDAINYALRRSGEFFNVDRSYLFQFSADGKMMDLTHEWCAAGVEPQIELLQKVAVESLPWWARRIRKGEPVYIPDVDALPGAATAEKQEFRRQMIRSLLTIPMCGEDGITGFLGFDSVKQLKSWSGEQLSLLKVVIEILNGALIRHRAEEELRSSEENLSITLHSIGDGVIATDTEGRVTRMNPVAERLTGWSLAEARGKQLTEVFNIINAQTGKVAGNPVNCVLKTGEIVGLANHTALIARDGTLRQIADCASPIRDWNGSTVGAVMVFSDVTGEYTLREKLRRIEWMLSPKKPLAGVKEKGSVQQYEDLIKSNRSRLIIDSVGEDILKDIVGDYADLLDTATVIFEKNGDYALSAFQSGWCRFLNYASLELCQAEDASSAIKSGKCLCHESCWTDASKKAIETGRPVDTECNGGIGIYAVPVWVYNRVEGAISMGYGDPPREADKLRKLSERYAVDYAALEARAKEYELRPPFIIELAKHRLHSAARMIGVLVENRQAEELLRESEALKSSIIEATPDILVRFNGEGRYLDIMFGENHQLYLPVAEKLGRTVDGILPGEVAAQFLDCIHAALQTGKLQTLKYGLDYPDGRREKEARFKSSGDDEVITFIRDITEEKQVEDALSRSEEKYREILASIEEGYYEADLYGNIVFCNEAAAGLLGYSREELLGINFRKLYKDHDTVFKAFNKVFSSGCPDRSFALEMIRKDGNSGYGELSISLIRDKDGTITGFRGVARDITKRIQYEERLKYLSLHDQLTGLYNRVFFEEEIKRLSSGSEHPVTIIIADLDDLKLINDSLGHDKGDRLLVVAADIIKKSLRESDILARVGGDEFVAILPRTEEAEAEAIVSRIRENVHVYNQKHSALPLGLSLGLASSKNNEASFKSVYKKADDLMYRDKLHHSTWARNQSVQALLMALAERDFITDGHAQRLQEYCWKVGERLKLSSSQMSDLALLSQVHDLGKVGIPDRILLKRKPLTEAEWEVMRMHPEKGYRIALSSTDLAGVADLILKHHEWWDGCGYPLGLAGVEIPIECRILAIVDAYDAMTNDRPYSNAISHENALQELKRCAGTQFDPELVDIFISLF